MIIRRPGEILSGVKDAAAACVVYAGGMKLNELGHAASANNEFVPNIVFASLYVFSIFLCLEKMFATSRHMFLSLMPEGPAKSSESVDTATNVPVDTNFDI